MPKPISQVTKPILGHGFKYLNAFDMVMPNIFVKIQHC